jgi:multidrug efflux pump subunit AcrA (membrane-fusion protein)
MDEEKQNDSTYFIPSLSIREPVFVVPPVPHLTKVPPPVIRKPPVQGFDMRTLRKQVEALNGEIEEKEETQNLLYTQNEQLWAYIQQLMQANKANAQLMREEVLKLHTELKVAHQERYNIAEKLQLARNSKQMLVELNQELKGAQLTAEEVARRKQEAEEALSQAKEENAHLEQVLRSQVQHMAGVNQELDDYRRRRLDEQALDLADDFFYTNKTILRAAYYRFRSGVQKRFKLNRISEAVSNTFRWHLKVSSFRSWCGFMHRKSIMRRNQARRRMEKLALCLQQWKVFAALEKYFKRSRRKQLLKRVFTAWRDDAKESAYERWAERATQELHTLQFKRKMFHAWRGRTMFLAWNSPMVGLLEQEARVHHARRLLRAWLQVSREAKEELTLRVRQVPRIVQWWHLTRWRELCESRWRRCVTLMRCWCT